MNSEPSEHKAPSGPDLTGKQGMHSCGLPHTVVHVHGLFQPGEGFYTIYDIPTQSVHYCCPSVKNCLGFSAEAFDAPLFNSRIHPKDREWMEEFERKKDAFYDSLTPEQISEYKIRYSFRFRHASGTYIRLLFQSLPLEVSPEGKVLRIVATFSDISWLVRDPSMSLSFIHIGVQSGRSGVAHHQVSKPECPFTPREREVLILLAKGNSNAEIAENLSISKITVSNHRKRMLSKTGAGNLLNLVLLARENRWV